MLTENLLNNFNHVFANRLISESLHLPHGTKSAKVVCHVDLDGVTSGISVVQQLVKQGIPKERITVEFAQYGDEDKDKNFDKRFKSDKPGQYVNVTDFAKLPKANLWKLWQSVYNFKGSPQFFIMFIESPDWRNTSREGFEKEFKRMESYRFQKSGGENSKFFKGGMDKLYKAFMAYKALEDYSKKNKKFKFEKINLQNCKEYSIPLVNPDFVSDHHSNELGALSGGKTGEIDTGAKSEAEFFANKYSSGMWSQADLKAISMVDSAGYTEEQLKNTVFLEKHFTGPDRQKNLATIISCIYDNLCKKDRNAAAWIIKNSQPSLVSLYNTTLKAANYNGKRLEYVTALKNGEVDKAKQLLSEIPGELNKRYDRRGNPTQPIMSLDDWKKKNQKDMANMKTGYKSEADEKKLEEIKGKRDKESAAFRNEVKNKKGKMLGYNNFAIFNGKDPKTQYTRYATSLFSQNGQRMPFSMRYWSSFFQIAKSPLYKGEVNFIEVNKHVLKDIEEFLREKGVNEYKIRSVIEYMDEKNGGHSGGIWTFQGFDKIDAPGSVKDDKFYVAQRILKKNENAPVANRVMEKKQPELDKYAEIRKQCLDRAKNSAVYWTNKLYPVSPEALKTLQTTDKDFEVEKK